MSASNQKTKRVRGVAMSVVFAALLSATLLLLAGSALAGTLAGKGDATQGSPIGSPGAQPAEPASPDCGPNWTLVSQSGPSAGPKLYSIAAVGANSVWAVGVYVAPSRNQYSTLTMHWNGTNWYLVPSPNAGSYFNANWLKGVGVIGPDDVWAVG